MFKYETHLHTAETSKCARSGGADMARRFAALGYAGIFVTDHFFNGNTTVPPELPWEERVALFCRGFDCAKDEGERLGLDVFFAWEYSLGWAHFLTYGLGRDWLLAHPDVTEWEIGRYIEAVHDAGGYVVHAHPFRKTNNPVARMLPYSVDGIEVLNAGRSDAENLPAASYARSLSLPETAGSDIHSVRAARLAGVFSETRFASGADYARALLGGQLKLFADAPV